MATSSKGRRSFTLLELLVVVSIIAILLALLLPAIAAARRQAKISEARTDIKNIQAAIRAYYNEYGKLPVQASEQGGVGANGCDGYYGEGGGGTNGDSGIFQYEIIDILRASNDTINVQNKFNPRQIVFLEIPNRANATINSGTLQGTFLDPWGNPYFIKLDNTGDGFVGYYNGSDCAGVGGFATIAVIVSYGPNGIQENPLQGRSDDICSFQQ